MSVDRAKHVSTDHIRRVIGKSQRSEWESRRLLPENLRRRAGKLASDTVERLGDAKAGRQIVDRPGDIEPIFGSSTWSLGMLSNDLAGTVLMYSLLA